MSKTLLFELNEVPFQVLDYYTRKYPKSHFATLIQSCAQYETYTEDEGHLHPWSTWPTLHRGIDNRLHKIKDFGENLTEKNQDYPPIWSLLIQHNVKVGVCGSLHTYPLPSDVQSYDFYIPDTFAAGTATHPKSIEPFQQFNLSQARASTRNVNQGINKNSAFNLVMHLPAIGIRIKTLAGIVKQLVDEKIAPWKIVRRRTVQSILAFDVFLNQLKKNKPQFSTFFSNHLASTMHRYWAATFKEDYEVYLLDEEWRNRYQNEIDIAMHHADNFLGEMLKFIKKEKKYKLLVASSMGQKSTKAMKLKSELLAKDFSLFLNRLGVDKADFNVLPAMHPQYNATFSSDEVRSLFISTLDKLEIKGKKIGYRTKSDSFISIDLGHVNLEENDITFEGNVVTPEGFGLSNELLQEEASGTAYHVPEGILLVYDTEKSLASKSRKRIDTKSISPSILKHFDINIPNYMESEFVESIIK